MRDLREKLAESSMSRAAIDRAADEAATDPELFGELLSLLDDDDTTVAWHAAWALLSILRYMPEEAEPDVDLLDFCLGGIFSARLSIASRSLCGKIAYSLCRRHEELREELRAYMESVDEECLPTAVASVRRNILKKLNK